MLWQDGVVHNPLSVRVNKNRLLEHGIVGLYLATPKTILGSQWRDLSSYRNDGTWTSADPRTNGMRGTNRTGGIRESVFDGTAGYVTLGQPASLNFTPGTNAFSILCAFRIGAIPVTNNALLVCKGLASATQYQLGIATVTGHLIYANKAISFSNCTTNVCDGKWHVAILSVPAASTGVLIFLDGIAEAFTAGTGQVGTTTDANDLIIGARRNTSNADAAKYFGGSLDCVIFFNRALNAAEACNWTNATKTGLAGVVSYSKGYRVAA